MNKGNGGNGKRLATKPNQKPLTAQEVDLAEMLADPEDTRSKDEKSIAAGFGPKTVYAKEKQPHFAVHLERRIGENFDRLKQARGQVLQAVRSRATSGDIADRDANAAAELFLKVTGDISTGGNIHLTQVQTNEAEVRQSRRNRLIERFEEVSSDSD